MAHITDTETKSCRCNDCDTSAKITTWSCGCVEVDICNNSDPCSDCSNFSDLRERCGDSGSFDSHRED